MESDPTGAVGLAELALAVAERLDPDTYGEERTAEARLQAVLIDAATSIWRVSQEPLDPLGAEPLPTHG